MAFWKKKRVLVTGGAGVIGRELLQLLGKKGAEVLSVDRAALPKEKWRGVSYVTLDLAKDSLDKLEQFRPTIIFHLAASFERSKESPGFWSINWNDNVLSSHRIVDLARRLASLNSFIFASSYLIYSPSLYMVQTPRNQAVFLKEEDQVDVRNLTGAAKYHTEKELDFIKGNFNLSLRLIHARIFRVYGCGSKDVISRWVRAALSGKTIKLYNKENRFDFIMSSDVAEGLVRLAESSSAEGTINLGSGISHSIDDIIKLLMEHFPSVRQTIQDLGKIESYEASCADITRLKQYIGWSTPTTIEQGIKKVIKYEQKQCESKV